MGVEGTVMAKKKTTTGLPKIAAQRLAPYIERGKQKGLWNDDSTVLDLFNEKAGDQTLKSTVEELGGLKSDIAVQFIADAVLVDLTDILRRTPYDTQIEVWEVSHTIIPSTGRPACFVSGAATVSDEQGTMEPAMFTMSLWDNDAALGDDLERDGVYGVNLTCKDLDRDVLILEPISGLTKFERGSGKFGNRADLLRESFDITPIAELEDNISRGLFDFRLVEATVVFAGVQPTKAGGQFGRIMLRDDSGLANIEEEEGELVLTGITSTDIATRFGKYSKILALMTCQESAKYGLNCNVKAAEAVILVAPATATKAAASGDDDGDDASNYFAGDDEEIPEVSLEDEEEDEEEEIDTDADPEGVVEEVEDEEEPDDTPLTDTADDDDDWVDDDDGWDDDDDKAADEPKEASHPDESDSPPTMTIAEAKKMSVANLRAYCRENKVEVDDLGHARKGEILDALDDANLLE